jgi:histidinol-phosphate/aromatic aminotransferase/cobyric acid decarboxylase-like protein
MVNSYKYEINYGIMKESLNDNFSHGDQFFSLSSNYDNLIDFSSNLYYGSAINFTVDEKTFNHYPSSYSALSDILSEKINKKTENLMIGYGMTPLIYDIFNLYSHSKVLLLEPIFSEHKRAALKNNCVITNLSIEVVVRNPQILKNFSFDLLSMNMPVNPTGIEISVDLLELIIKICQDKNAMVFIDQAYLDFLPTEEQREIGETFLRYSNVIMGRSLTKITGMPGIRLGYLLGSAHILKKLKRYAQPWTIPQFYINILKNWSAEPPDLKELGNERKFLMDGLHNMGFKILGNSRVNFFSFSLPKTVNPDFFQMELEKKGFLIRNIGNFYGFNNNDFRISVKDHESNSKILSAVKEVIDGKR